MSDMISGLGISDGRIVWHDKRSGNLDIYIYNLSSGEGGQRLSFSPDDQASPSISGDLVVWEEENGREYDIFLYNLTSKDLKRITIPTPCGKIREFQGIMLSGRRSGMETMMSVATMSRRAIRPGLRDEPVQQIWPRISGDIVVWTDNRTADDYEVYAYDLSAQTEIQVTNDRVDQIWADVDSNNIVWMDNGAAITTSSCAHWGMRQAPGLRCLRFGSTPSLKGLTFTWTKSLRGVHHRCCTSINRKSPYPACKEWFQAIYGDA
jgi:beta propeller repeat protein